MHAEIGPAARRAAAGVLIGACLVLLHGPRAWSAFEVSEVFAGNNITSRVELASGDSAKTEAESSPTGPSVSTSATSARDEG